MERPKTPEEKDCCGNGCCPCIFDVHKKLVEIWKKRRHSDDLVNKKHILDLLSYKQFVVYKKEDVNDEFFIIWVKYEGINHGEKIFIKPGQHVMISIPSYSRPFTPISWTDDSLQFLVRNYKESPFTNKLKNLEINEEIRIRGPYGEFQYSRNSFKKILMLGIGSGVAAFYSIVKEIAEDELEDTRVNMILGFKSVELIPLRRELQLLTDYWNVDCSIHLSDSGEQEKVNGIELKEGKIDEMVVRNILNNENYREILVLICGNEKFNKFIRELVEEMNVTNFHVFE